MYMFAEDLSFEVWKYVIESSADATLLRHAPGNLRVMSLCLYLATVTTCHDLKHACEMFERADFVMVNLCAISTLEGSPFCD